MKPPYEIVSFPSQTRQIPFKVYPNGLQVAATQEEMDMFSAYQHAKTELETVRKAREIEEEMASRVAAPRKR